MGWRRLSHGLKARRRDPSRHAHRLGDRRLRRHDLCPFVKPSLPTGAEEIARCSASQFDPTVVRAFLNIGLRRCGSHSGHSHGCPTFPSWSSPYHLGGIDTVGGVATASVLTVAAVTGTPPPQEPRPPSSAQRSKLTSSSTDVTAPDLDVTGDRGRPLIVTLQGSAATQRHLALTAAPNHGEALSADHRHRRLPGRGPLNSWSRHPRVRWARRARLRGLRATSACAHGTIRIALPRPAVLTDSTAPIHRDRNQHRDHDHPTAERRPRRPLRLPDTNHSLHEHPHGDGAHDSRHDIDDDVPPRQPHCLHQQPQWPLPPRRPHDGLQQRRQPHQRNDDELEHHHHDDHDNNDGSATTTTFPQRRPAPRRATVGNEDRTQVIPLADLLVNDSDANSDPLTISSVHVPVNGTVQMTTTHAVFVPDADYYGHASFTYTVCDPGNLYSRCHGHRDPRPVAGCAPSHDDGYSSTAGGPQRHRTWRARQRP